MAARGCPGSVLKQLLQRASPVRGEDGRHACVKHAKRHVQGAIVAWCKVSLLGLLSWPASGLP